MALTIHAFLNALFFLDAEVLSRNPHFLGAILVSSSPITSGNLPNRPCWGIYPMNLGVFRVYSQATCAIGDGTDNPNCNPMTASVDATQQPKETLKDYYESDGVRFYKASPSEEKKPKRKNEGKILYRVYDTDIRTRLEENSEYFVREWKQDEFSQYESYVLIDIYGREIFSNKFINRVIKNLPKKDNIQLHITTGKMRKFTSPATGETVEYIKPTVVVEEIPDKSDN